MEWARNGQSNNTQPHSALVEPDRDKTSNEWVDVIMYTDLQDFLCGLENVCVCVYFSVAA